MMTDSTTRSKQFVRLLNHQDIPNILQNFTRQVVQVFDAEEILFSEVQNKVEKFYEKHPKFYLHVEDASYESDPNNPHIVNFKFIMWYRIVVQNEDSTHKNNDYNLPGIGIIHFDSQSLIEKFLLQIDTDIEISIWERRKLKKKALKFNGKRTEKLEKLNRKLKAQEDNQQEYSEEEKVRIANSRQQKWEKIHQRNSEKKQRRKRLEDLENELKQQEKQYFENPENPQPDWVMGRVCIDFSFLNLMDSFATGSIRNQLACIYQTNLQSTIPMQVYLCCDKQTEGAFNNLLEKLSGVEAWSSIALRPSTDVTELYDESKNIPIVYLSPDADEPLLSVDKNHLYVIGGLCDRDRKHNLTKTKCENLKIDCKRLPIAEHVTFAGNKILTISAVFALLAAYLENPDWVQCFQKVLPKHIVTTMKPK